MAAAALLVSAISILSLYHTAIEQHRLRLVETVKSQARLIESIAQFDSLDSDGDDPRLVLESTLEKVAAAHNEFEGFGDTGEFTLAQREGDQIVFILTRRHLTSETPRPIPFAGEWAEPTRRALSGESGVLIGLDYRGAEVLAAYEPVSLLDLSLVAKINTSEIRRPFIRAGIVSILVAMLVIFIASRVFFRISRPLEEAIDQQAETFRTLAQTSREGIVLADTDGEINFVNPAVEKLFGYRPGELLGQNVSRLMPREYSSRHDTYLKNYLQSGIPRIIGSGRQLTAMRKDGSRFPIYLSIGDIRTSHKRLFAGVIVDVSEQQQLQREILEIPVSEQRRIGQELHDGLGQQLTGLGLLATSLVNKASKPEHELATRLAAGLQEAIAQVRALSRGLMPVDIDAEGLINSLETMIENMRVHSDIDIELDVRERVRITDNSSALHLFRIAQEALNNAIKHAGAKHIEVSVGRDGERGCLSVRDDGIGIAPRSQKTPGLGLRIMKHRCGLIDAELKIDASGTEGTEIKCYFPIENTSVSKA